MPRLIDGDALIEPMENACMGVMSGCTPFNEPMKILESAPTVDAVEVVRCKDCKLWDKYPSSSVLNFHECHAHIGRISTQAFEYCYRGERKDGAETD